MMQAFSRSVQSIPGRAPTRPHAAFEDHKYPNELHLSRDTAKGIFMETSYPKNGTTLLPQPATNRGLGEKISAAILPFQVKHVAEAANRTPEAAKKWRQGFSCPDLASAINMARDIPVIKWLIYREIEGGSPEGMFSNRLVVDALAMLQTLADGDSEYAQRAREILAGKP
jgi:hypothetical protein